jgi:4-hydroxybenzoate polyprenyltransferase
VTLTKIAEIAKFFTSNALLLALDGPLVVYFGYMIYGLDVNITIIAASFLGVFSIYTLNKATDKKEDRINKPNQPLRSTTHYITVSLVTMIFSLVLGITVSLFTFFILLAPTLVGILYSVRVSPRLPRLKEVVGAKSVLVAFSWSLYGAFLPLTLHGLDFHNIALVFTYIFMQVLINTILFDFFDIRGDRESGIRTLPTVLGANKTKKMLFLVNSVLAIIIAWCEIQGYFLRLLPALFFGVVYGYFIIWHFVREPVNRLSAELLVDGAWFPLVAIVRLILR